MGQVKNKTLPNDNFFKMGNSYCKESCHLCKIFNLVLDSRGENNIFAEIGALQKFYGAL